MKSQFKLLIISIFLIGEQVYAQYPTNYLSYEYIEILSYSIKITYSTTGDYKPTTIYDFYGNALNTLQARYDQNRKVVEQEYGKLWNLELINNSNKVILNQYKSTIKDELDAKSRSADFSKSYVTDEYINFITQPFRVPSIADEIKLLQNCQKELNRIKKQDPNNYIYSKRYNAIKQTLSKLENCDPSEIKYIGWENAELNNSSSSNNSSSYRTVNPTKEQLSRSGSVRFYINQNIGPVNIYVQGALIGTLDQYFVDINYIPTCEDNLGGAVEGLAMYVGTYPYYATAPGLKWEGQFTIEPGGCKTIRLSK